MLQGVIHLALLGIVLLFTALGFYNSGEGARTRPVFIKTAKILAAIGVIHIVPLVIYFWIKAIGG